MNSRKSRTPGAVILAIISAGVVTCGLIAFMLFSASRSERIFLLSNEQITVTGYDGNGRVSDTFHPEYYGIRQISVSDSHRKDLISSVDCGAYPSSGLSNGDIVTYSCTYDHAAASAAGIRLERTVKTYRVTGLTAYSEVDLFAGVTAEWSDNSEHPVILHIPDQFTSSGIQYSTGFGGEPNTRCCPVCTGQPGSLPVLNEKAGEAAYLVFGSLLEMTAAVVALGFVLVAGIMIMLLPAVGLIRWLTH